MNVSGSMPMPIACSSMTRADALAAVDPALGLVDVREQDTIFFIKMPPSRYSALSKQSEMCYYVG